MNGAIERLQEKRTGGKPMAQSQIYRIFKDTFYYGYYEYPRGSDSWYKGAHEPMVTQEEYERVQILLGRKGNTRPQKKYFSFTGPYSLREMWRHDYRRRTMAVCLY